MMACRFQLAISHHSQLWTVLLFLFALRATTTTAAAAAAAAAMTSNKAENVHAVVVSSSRYWFNYRHAVNALAMYQRLRRNGIPESNIVLMVADDLPTNPRNPFKNAMFPNGVSAPSVYNASTHIDYRGADVTVSNFLHVVLGTQAPITNRRVIHSNAESNLLIYITGHGGDQFFKFQDEEELTATDIANMMRELHRRQRYSKLLWIADTCQAFTLGDEIDAPNVYALGTSLRGQNAYAHHSDSDVGLSVMERWTFGMLQYYENFATPDSTLQEVLVDGVLKPGIMNGPLGAEIGVNDKNCDRPFSQVLASEFFGTKPSASGGQQRDRKKAKKRNLKQAVNHAWKNRLPVYYTSAITPPTRVQTKGLPLRAESSWLQCSDDDTCHNNTEFFPSTQIQNDAYWEPTDYDFYRILAILILLIVVSSFWRRPDEHASWVAPTTPASQKTIRMVRINEQPSMQETK